MIGLITPLDLRTRTYILYEEDCPLFIWWFLAVWSIHTGMGPKSDLKRVVWDPILIVCSLEGNHSDCGTTVLIAHREWKRWYIYHF